MPRLANFSIETDNMVLLQFQGGQEQRVPIAQLAEYLPKADLVRVRAALKLRRDFLKIHMPKAGVLAFLAGSALIALFIGGERAVAQLLHPPAPLSSPTAPHSEIAHMIEPSASPVAPAAQATMPQTQPAHKLAATPKPVKLAKAKVKAPQPKSTHLTDIAVPSIIQLPQLSAAPIITPVPTPEATPAPSPTPIAADPTDPVDLLSPTDN